MFRSTTSWGWLGAALLVLLAAMPVQAQRQVTLTLNMATSGDTTRTDSFIEVRGAADGVEGVFNDQGDVIAWNDTSTLEPVNVGGDYWQIQFELPDTTDLTFKFYSQQSQDILGEGWEADPNPNIPDGTSDTTLTVHFYESQREYRGVSGDRGPYDWRPYESKVDSIAVWYRVYMNTPEGQLDGYDRTNPNHHAAVTGDGSVFAGSPFDWGSSNDGKGVALMRESTNDQAPGYDLFSGVVYYPLSAAGTTQLYKFVLEDESGIVGWEEGDLVGNREFVVPSQDTTLQWVYFGNQAPDPNEPVTQNVIFAVDLASLEDIGIFRTARGDTLEVRGGFNGWGCSDPTLCLMDRVPGETLFEGFFGLTLRPGTEVAYKYFLNFNNPEFITEFGFEPPPGWEEGHRTGVDRLFTFEGNPNNDQDLGLSFFNDITDLNVIPEGTSITVNYSVDMAAAVANAARPFDASAGDSVFIVVQDPLWALTQRISNPSIPFRDPTEERPVMVDVLSDGDSDGVYTGSVTIEGPTYSNLTYTYSYGQGADLFGEPGTGLGAVPGRNRTNYIKPNPDGSWPASYDIGAQSFMVQAGPLPFEDNPAFSVGVEPVDGELPASITLKQNFPNPFNPTTTFEYAITASQKVELHVYDVIGRRVATLVNGVQPANTYRVNFDASDLASGTYFYRLETADKVITRSMVLLK